MSQGNRRYLHHALNSYLLYFSNTLQTTSFNPKIVLIVNPWKLLLFLCNWMWLTLKSNKRKVEKQRNLSLLFRFTAVRYYIYHNENFYEFNTSHSFKKHLLWYNCQRKDTMITISSRLSRTGMKLSEIEIILSFLW